MRTIWVSFGRRIMKASILIMCRACGNRVPWLLVLNLNIKTIHMAPLSTMKRLVMLLAVIMLGQSCRKQFLDAKPSSTLVVPTTLSQFQALLDNTGVFGLVPTLGEASADNYWFPNDYWNGLDTRE